MQCSSCGTDIRPGQKFCMECGAALVPDTPDVRRGPATLASTATPQKGRAEDDPTRPVVIPRRAGFAPPSGSSRDPRRAATERAPSSADDTTVAAVARATSPVRHASSGTTTADVTVVTADTEPVRLEPSPPFGGWPAASTPSAASENTGRLPVVEDRTAAAHERRTFRLRPLLVLAVVATAATIVGVLTPVIEISGDGGAPQVGTWLVNDFGTNNTIAGLLAAGAMVIGALAWCFGLRWGAGLAGGGGAALAGWVALVIGLAEWPLLAAGRAAVVPSGLDRTLGYWVLVGAGGVGALVLVMSLARSGRGGRSGLDPWIAALGAVAVLIAAGGPLIPEGNADWQNNFRSESGFDLPTMFFIGRAVQLGLLALCGVAGFLLVRRWGLGLAIGSAVSAGWLLVTAATEQTASPIGPGYANPGVVLDPLVLSPVLPPPHAVTIVGMAMLGFFALVAVVMALLDADR